MKRTSAKMFALTCLMLAGASWVAAQDAPEKIAAKPVTSDLFDGGDASNLDPYLSVNEAGDRVGVQFRKCEQWAEQETTPQCEPGQLVYVFPQLHLDPQSKQVMLGETPVGRLTLGGGVELSSDYKLDYSVVAKTEDSGFERRQARHIEVFMERK